MKVLVLNGPNLNMLGYREPSIYGTTSYNDLVKMIQEHANKIGVLVDFYQSNHEGFLIDKIQEAFFKKFDGIVFNPGGFTHTSVALLDAIKSVNIPTIEVHISDVSKREEFRKVSLIRNACLTSYIGLGIEGYFKALDYLKENNNGCKN